MNLTQFQELSLKNSKDLEQHEIHSRKLRKDLDIQLNRVVELEGVIRFLDSKEPRFVFKGYQITAG